MSWVLFWQIVILAILGWLMIASVLSMVLDHVRLDRRRKSS